MGDLKEEIIAKASGTLVKKPEESISGVKQASEDMNVIENTLETARKLAGTEGLAEQIKGKDAALAKAGEEKDKLKDELHESQVLLIQKELGGKIDQLSETIKGGGSPKSISDQIIEIKKAAESLGLGGSKVSEIKEIMDLVTKLNPQQKGLAEQVKDAKDLVALLQPEGKKEALVEGVPASVAIQLKEMDNNLKITLEKMKDDRQERDQQFKLTLLQFEEDRDLRRQQIDGELAVQKERNQILSGTMEIIGRAAGKAIAESGGLAGAPREEVITQHKTPGPPQHYKIQATEGAAGELPCPNCNAGVGIGPTTVDATCIGCGSEFHVERVPASTEPIPKEEQ